MNTHMDGQPQNIMPPATSVLDGRRQEVREMRGKENVERIQRLEGQRGRGGSCHVGQDNFYHDNDGQTNMAEVQ